MEEKVRSKQMHVLLKRLYVRPASKSLCWRTARDKVSESSQRSCRVSTC